MIDITKVAEVKITYSNPVPAKERPKITGSDDIADLMQQWWDKFMPETKEYVESFVIVLLNQDNRVLGARCIGTGGITGTVVDVTVVAQHALKANAKSVILCHNHPSGNIKPSDPDKNITKLIAEGLKTLGVTVLDHVIITSDPSRYYSFADSGDL